MQICSNTLKSSILGLDNLGDFSVQIMDIVEQIAASQVQGSESVEQLCGRLKYILRLFNFSDFAQNFSM